MRAVRTAVTLAPVFLAALVLAAAGPSLRDVALAARDPQHYIDSAGPDSAAVLVVGVVGWLVLGWLVLGVGAVAATRLPGAAGAVSQAVAERTLPAAVRRAAAVALGVSLASGAGVAAGSNAAVGPAGYGAAGTPVAAAAVGGSAAYTAHQPAGPIDADWPETGSAGAGIPTPRVNPAFRATTPAPTGIDWPTGAADATSRPLRRHVSAHHRRHITPHRVVVQAGDCLWDLARAHLPAGASDARVAREWPRWYAANRALIGTDPNLIHPGQVLIVPADPTS